MDGSTMAELKTPKYRQEARVVAVEYLKCRDGWQNVLCPQWLGMKQTRDRKHGFGRCIVALGQTLHMMGWEDAGGSRMRTNTEP